MTVRAVATVERAGEGTCRLIVCECGQILAREHANGDIEPVIVGWRWDTEGRAYVRCPNCGRRKRLPLRRVA